MVRTAKMLASGALMAAAFAADVGAQPAPDTQGGRFSFTPVRDGLMRLDVRTGQVSMCKADNNGWACDITPDERTAFDNEIGRLTAEVARLKSELASRATSMTEAAKTDVAKAEAAKAEAAKADVAKAEAAKAEAARQEAAARAETAKADAAKAESLAKAETAKAEVAKAEAARAEALAKTEMAKAETAKAELSRAELARLAKAEAEKSAPPIPPAPIPAPAKSVKAETKSDVAKGDVAPGATKDATRDLTKDSTKAEPSTGAAAVVTIDKNGRSETVITVPVPSDRQVAEAKSFLSRAWQQFVERVNRLFGRQA